MKRDSRLFLNMISAACCAIVGGITFVTDRNVFTFPPRSSDGFSLAVTDYCICKILMFALLYAVFYGLFTIIWGKNETAKALREMLKCAAFYLPVMAVILFVKLPEGFLSNDEYAIAADAIGLIHDTWFNYMTVYYYIVSFMLFPVKTGPIIMKVLIELAVIGYCVYRSGNYFGKKAGMFMYILFLLYPLIAYTTSAHRLPVYFLIYLTLFVKLCFDRLEKKDITWPAAILLMFTGAVLTQWRTEGIYLLVLIPILLMIVYMRFRDKKAAVFMIVCYLCIQYVLSIPQNGLGSENLGGAANDRMKPFYAYTITNMYRNGLDTDKNGADLEAVDRYISLESIEAINAYYEDINYEDVLILIKEEFGGVREDADYTQYWEFTEAVRRIIINNPDVFLRTRWGAFCYSALPFKVTFSGTGLRELVSFGISIVKSVSYNLFIPVIFIAVFFIYSLIRKRWFDFFVSGGLICHWFIVFILAPASYFKYYFPVYIMAYFYILMIVIGYCCNRGGKHSEGN